MYKKISSCYYMAVNLNLKSDFIGKYNNITSKYDALGPIGEMTFKTSWPALVAILCIVLSIITYATSKNNVDPETKKKLDRTTGKKFLLALSILFLLSSFGGIGYAVYLYFTIYKVQYNLWYTKLPDEAKLELTTIKTIDSLQNQVNQMIKKN